MRHRNGQANQEFGMAELARQVVEHAQRKALEHVGVAELWIAIGEDVFPGDEGVVKHDRAIELIEARAQWIGEPVLSDHRWLAAQDLDARSVGGTAEPHGAFRRGDGRRERHNQDVVSIAERSAKAERAADHNATISFFHYLWGEPLRRWPEAVGLWPREGPGRQQPLTRHPVAVRVYSADAVLVATGVDAVAHRQQKQMGQYRCVGDLAGVAYRKGADALAQGPQGVAAPGNRQANRLSLSVEKCIGPGWIMMQVVPLGESIDNPTGRRMAANVGDPLPSHPHLPPIVAAVLKLGARPELALRSHSNSLRAASGSLLLTPGLIFSAQAFVQWKRLAQARTGSDLGP